MAEKDGVFEVNGRTLLRSCCLCKVLLGAYAVLPRRHPHHLHDETVQGQRKDGLAPRLAGGKEPQRAALEGDNLYSLWH